VTPEDALLAVDHGADAIFVSNHGGRQLDHAPPTLDVLRSIATAVKGRVPVVCPRFPMDFPCVETEN
jgi:isopentenyl diphosphate isomerase/L-lactate dehydrogenase-like FMN-dependent dehydrogenase